MSNTEYLQELKNKNISGVWAMYLLYCHINGETPSRFSTLKKWLHNEI